MPRRSSNKSQNQSWINVPAARARLAEIPAEIARLERERDFLRDALAATGAGAAAAPARRGPGRPPGRPAAAAPFGRRPGRPPRGGGPSLLDIITDVMKAGPASKGWTVGDLRVEIAKRHPEKVAAANASALVSSALVQSMRAKQPRFTGTKAGRGQARKYRLAGGAAA